jgi:predicted ATP-dependent protease
VEKKPTVGGYVTDFTLIKAGSISRANGGYLVVYDRDVLANAGVWEALQRVIKNRELRIEEPAAFFGWVPPQGLRPEPIPTDTKVIMIGEPHLYRTLATMDPDFRETFKVKADFDFKIDRSPENIVAFACFIRDYCNREKLRHFDPSGGSADHRAMCASGGRSRQAFDSFQRRRGSADRVRLLGRQGECPTDLRKAC